MMVLDCSVAVSWCFADEATPALDALLDRVLAEGAVVPPLWALEIGNVLIQAARRKRLPDAGVRQRLALLDMLPITTDEGGIGRVWRDNLFTLAEAEGLTVYDATYLELAIRLGLPLATGDKALRGAARKRGIATLPS